MGTTHLGAPGGAKIKMTLERATPKGKVGGGEANGKTKVGEGVLD